MCAAYRAVALIYHPVLDVTVQVPARAVHIWERSGWQPVESPDQFASEPADDPSPVEGDPPEPPTQED